MFIWSLKTSKRELLILGIGIVVFLAAVIYVVWPRETAQTSALVKEGYSTDASTREEREHFLTQFGWKIEPEPMEVREVVIPTEFSDVYLKYNELQLAQGFDLERLKGVCVKRWTYRITNYPGTKDVIVANMLVLDGRVVGGDVCSTSLSGFMHGFSPQDSAEHIVAMSENLARSEAEADRAISGKIPEYPDAPPEEDE